MSAQQVELRYTVAPNDDGGFVAVTSDGAYSAWGVNEGEAEEVLQEAVTLRNPDALVHLFRHDGAS